MSTLTVVLIVIAILAIGFAFFMYRQKHRTAQLRGKFGTEYDRVVENRGNQKNAEEELTKRQKRVEKFRLRELTRTEMDRFSVSWKTIQTQFVDSPRGAVAEADRLVHEAMTARGYPMGDFDQCAADISVDHPDVVSNYRAAHDLATRDAAGKGSTEDLRQAMVHYRALFEDLIGKRVEDHREHHEQVLR